jgi:biotin transport system substrate-specific component
VLMWAICWGWKVGVAATTGYLAMGAMGLPVFANGAGGIEHFMGSTAGFLWAFPVSAIAIGMLAERLTQHQFIGAAGLFLLGQAVILGLGIPFRLAVTQTQASFMDLIPSLLPPVMIKTALGTLVVVAVGRLLAPRRDVP